MDPGIYLGVPLRSQCGPRNLPGCAPSESVGPEPSSVSPHELGTDSQSAVFRKQGAETSSWRGHFENMGSQSALRTLPHSALRKTRCISPILRIGSLRLRELE